MFFQYKYRAVKYTILKIYEKWLLYNAYLSMHKVDLQFKQNTRVELGPYF